VASWQKIGASIRQNPKCLQAGYFATNTFIDLLLINRFNDHGGLIPVGYANPAYLAQVTGLAREADILKISPEEVMEFSLDRAERSGLLAREGAYFSITGWGPEWSLSKDLSTDRVRKCRERKRSGDLDPPDETVRNGTKRNGTTRNGETHIEEKRGEEKRGEALPPNPRQGGGGATDLQAVLEGLQGSVADTATAAKAAVVRALEAAGFEVETQIPVADRGDGYGGRLGALAVRDGVRVAVEFSNRTPTGKAVTKLQESEADIRVVVVRGEWVGGAPEGVDLVVGLRCVTQKQTRIEKALEELGDEATEVWAYQESLRAAIIPTSRRLKPKAEALARVADCIRAYGKERAFDVLDHIADRVRRDAGQARWFNGVSHWREENFLRILGQIGTPESDVRFGRVEPQERPEVEGEVKL